jgi:hypothetical protein
VLLHLLRCACRGEKKILNEMNTRKEEGGPKYRVLDANKQGKAKERISTAEEKIYILVWASTAAYCSGLQHITRPLTALTLSLP